MHEDCILRQSGSVSPHGLTVLLENVQLQVFSVSRSDMECLLCLCYAVFMHHMLESSCIATDAPSALYCAVTQ